MTDFLAIISLKDGRQAKDTEYVDELNSNCYVSFLCQRTRDTKLDVMFLADKNIIELSIRHTLIINEINLSRFILSSCQERLLASMWLFSWICSNTNWTEHREHLTDQLRDAFSILCTDPFVKNLWFGVAVASLNFMMTLIESNMSYTWELFWQMSNAAPGACMQTNTLLVSMVNWSYFLINLQAILFG